MTSCKLARNAEFQAIIPVRGKTLNCIKASYERIFKSEIICDLLRVIGCGVELQGKHKTDMAAFDIANLRWNKIIICTDADEDGFQIRTLLLTLFYRLLPTLLREGKVYIAETPLFEITPNKGEIEFAYNRIREKRDSEAARSCGQEIYFTAVKGTWRKLRRHDGKDDNESRVAQADSSNALGRGGYSGDV